MRKVHFLWTYVVFASVLTIYGFYSLFYSMIKGHDIPTLGIAFIFVGPSLFILLLVLWIIGKHHKPKVVDQPIPDGPTKEEFLQKQEEARKEAEEARLAKEQKSRQAPQKEEEEPQEEEQHWPVKNRSIYDNAERVSSVRSRSGYSSSYVNRLGSGLVLRVSGERIYDMRSNAYYRIEGGYVKLEGSGPVFEINGNRIRKAYGEYLFSISGNNISKVYGGFFASISGNYLTTFDGSEKYDLGGQLSKDQILAIMAILFGNS